MLSFDEVHGLFETKVEGNENVFHSLRRALSYITKEKRVVSLFLSTVSDVYKCAPPAYMDPSEHIQKSYISILPAFTETGFDQLAVGLVKKDEKTLEEMVTDEWMCNFGRPLYVPELFAHLTFLTRCIGLEHVINWAMMQKKQVSWTLLP